MKTYKNISEYIRSYPKAVQLILSQVRAVIRKAAPDAEEAISYGIPTTVWFPIDKPMPFALITKIVKFRVAQQEQMAKKK